MSTKRQRSSWAFPLFGTIAILAIAGFVQLSDPHATPAPGAALPHLPSAKAWRSRIASQSMPPSTSSPPVIDPVLTYSTFLGGTNFAGPGGPQQQAYASFVDGPGNVYVTGPTNALDFPVTPGTVQTTNASGASISFLTKINPAGTSLVFSTYLNLSEVPVLAVDGSGNIFVGGANPSFPIPPGTTPYQATPRGILIVKLNSTATAVLNATYLGGSGNDTLSGLAADANGNLYAAGYTTSNDFPTKNAFQAALGSGGSSSFVTKLDPTLSTLLYSTYLGQNSSGGSLAVDASNAYVAGQASSGFPVTSGAIQSSCAGECGTLAKLNSTASGAASLLYATYIGGTSTATTPAAVAVDSSQNVYISGFTASGFPEINSLQPCAPTVINGFTTNAKGFVTEVNAGGALAFSTCLGNNTVTDVVVDSSGIVYVTGSADATLPLTNPIETIATPPQGAQFVAAINASTGSFLFSSFVSGIQSPGAIFKSVGVDSSGNIVAAGITIDAPFPTFNAFQPSPSAIGSCSVMGTLVLPCSASDVIIVKISPTAGAAAAVTPASVTFPPQQLGTASAVQTFTIIDMGSDALTVSNATVTGDFSIQNGCASVAASGGTCAIQVAFTPTATGTRTGTLSITDSSAGSPHTVSLSGTGGQASVQFSPTSISFSPSVNNQGSGQTQLMNVGTLPVQISSIQVSNPAFSETNNCGASVAPSSSCNITINFTPTSTTTATGNLIITDSASNSPQTIPITATPTADQIGIQLDPSQSNYQTVTLNAGQSVAYALWLGDAGTTGTATLSCSGLPRGANCSFQFSPVQISGSGSITSDVLTLTTTARSSVFLLPPGIIPWFGLALVLCALFLVATRFGVLPRRLRWALVPLLALALGACGGGSGGGGGGGTPAGTYNFKVVGTAGSVTQSMPLTLIVN